MKKIICTFVLIWGLLPSVQVHLNSVTIHLCATKATAQDCPTNVYGDGDNPNGNIWVTIGTAISGGFTDVYNWISGLFSNDYSEDTTNDDGETYGETSSYGTEGTSPSDFIGLFFRDYNYNTSHVQATGATESEYNNLRNAVIGGYELGQLNLYGQSIYGSNYNTYLNNTYNDEYNYVSNAGGIWYCPYDVLFPDEGEVDSTYYQAYLNSLPKDTLKPRIDTLNPNGPDSIKVRQILKAAQELDSVYGKISTSIEDSAIFKPFVRHSRYINYEEVFNINRIGTYPNDTATEKVYRPVAADYNDTGRSPFNSTTIWTSDQAYSMHNHPPKGQLQPSPVDMKSMLSNWKSSNNLNPNHPARGTYRGGFNMAADADTSVFALVVTDSTKARKFIDSSGIFANMIDTATSPPLINNWSTTTKANINGRMTSLWNHYKTIYDQLKKDNYTNEFVEIYANVILMDKLGMGISVYRKINGQFKRLSYRMNPDPQATPQYILTIED